MGPYVALHLAEPLFPTVCEKDIVLVTSSEGCCGVQVGTRHIVGAQEWLTLSFLFVLLAHLLSSFNTVHTYSILQFIFFFPLNTGFVGAIQVDCSHIHLPAV